MAVAGVTIGLFAPAGFGSHACSGGVFVPSETADAWVALKSAGTVIDVCAQARVPKQGCFEDCGFWTFGGSAGTSIYDPAGYGFGVVLAPVVCETDLSGPEWCPVGGVVPLTTGAETGNQTVGNGATVDHLRVWVAGIPFPIDGATGVTYTGALVPTVKHDVVGAAVCGPTVHLWVNGFDQPIPVEASAGNQSCP